MTEYAVEIDGKLNLEEIGLQIAAEEAGASEFRAALLDVRQNRPINRVVFAELPPGKKPSPIRIVREGHPPPSNGTWIWSGTMAVDGITIPVTAYRVT